MGVESNVEPVCSRYKSLTHHKPNLDVCISLLRHEHRNTHTYMDTRTCTHTYMDPHTHTYVSVCAHTQYVYMKTHISTNMQLQTLHILYVHKESFKAQLSLLIRPYLTGGASYRISSYCRSILGKWFLAFVGKVNICLYV